MRPARILKAFAGRDDGGIAILFGLSLMALAITAGLAFDYSRSYSVQSSLQASLDAAVLSAAAQATDETEFQSVADRYFQVNWGGKHQSGPAHVSVASAGPRRIRGTVTTTVPATLMRLAGRENIAITASTEIELSNQNVELALVLDTTASMSGGKLSALKSAAETLLETAYEKPEASEHVKIALVPFAQYVNVGMANRNAPWMSVPPDTTVDHDGCGFVSPVISTSNCRMETFTGHNDGVPYSYQSEVCDTVYGDPVYQCTPWTETIAWYGCAGPRENPLDTLDDQYETPIPGTMNVVCSSPITPLTNDTGVLSGAIDAMTATGDTYIPTGLMWGWRALSSTAPYEEGVGYSELVDGAPVRKVLVLMTDGFNTRSPIYPSADPANPSHNGSDSALANTRTAEICTNIKAAGIIIYSVAFEVDDDDIKDILRSCASDPGKFFDAPEEEQLEEAFADIGADLSPLRIVN